MNRVAIYAVIVSIFGAYWSWKLLQWYLSANSLLYCVLGTQCPLVFQSAMSYFYGVPIHVFAVIWFSILALLGLARAYGKKKASLIGMLVGALCIPTIIYLDYIMVAIIHAICSDCELAHLTGLFAFVLFIILYRSDRKSGSTKIESNPKDSNSESGSTAKS